MLRDPLAVIIDLDEKEFSRDSRGGYIRPEKHRKGNNASAKVANTSPLSFLQMLRKNFSVSTSDEDNKVSEIIRQRHMKRNEPFIPVAENLRILLKAGDNDSSCLLVNNANGAHDESLLPASVGSGLRKLSIARLLKSITHGREEGVNKNIDGYPKGANVESSEFFMNGEIPLWSALPSLASDEGIKSFGLQNIQSPDRILPILKDVLRSHGYAEQYIEKITEGLEKAVDAQLNEVVFGMKDGFPLGNAIPGEGDNQVQTAFPHQAGPVSMNMEREQRRENYRSLNVFPSIQGKGEERGSVVGDFKSPANITLHGDSSDVMDGILFDLLISKGFDEEEASNILADVRGVSKHVYAIGDAVQNQYDAKNLSSLDANIYLNNVDHDRQATLMKETDAFLEKRFSWKMIIASPNNPSESSADGGAVADKDQKNAGERYGRGLNLLNADRCYADGNYRRDSFEELINKNNSSQYSLILKNREVQGKPFSDDMSLEMNFLRQGKGTDNKNIEKSNSAIDIHGAFDIPVMGAGDRLQKIESNSSIEMNTLIEQVADKLPTALNKGTGRVLINLTPPHLGSIEIDIMVRESRVQVLLTAGNRDVQQVLQFHADRLRDALQQHGIQVESYDVLYNEDYSYHEGQFGWSNLLRQEDSRRHNNGREPVASSTTPVVSPITDSTKRQAQREGISVFV